MATREQVEALLHGGHTYETAARELGIPGGLAFMIATGRPADGSGAPPPPQRGGLTGSSQHLVNPPPFNPTRDPDVIDWVKQRAERDLVPPA